MVVVLRSSLSLLLEEMARARMAGVFVVCAGKVAGGFGGFPPPCSLGCMSPIRGK